MKPNDRKTKLLEGILPAKVSHVLQLGLQRDTELSLFSRKSIEDDNRIRPMRASMTDISYEEQKVSYPRTRRF